MNAKLNALIAAEIGVDDGSFLPFKDFVDWGNAGQHQSLAERRASFRDRARSERLMRRAGTLARSG